MVLYVKNPKLKAKVFKAMKYYDDLAIKAYQRGDTRMGKRHESKSDKLYKDNYNKIFAKR